jgi:hypothetical protein
MILRSLTILLLLLTLCGCGFFARHGLPDDPLFISRPPLEAKATQAPPSAVVHPEPAPPPNPYRAE